MDATERARLRALCRGIAMPWEAADHVEDGEIIATGTEILCESDDLVAAVVTVDMGFDRACDEAHAALIVGAVNALPALLDTLDAAERERDAAVAMLRNLLARVHRDGGQHVDAVGLAQATEEADEIIARAFAELARLRAPRPSAIVLRPVDPMTVRGLPCACDEWGPGHLDGCPNGDAEPANAPVPFDDEDLTLADGDRRALDAAERERDEARAEVERLRTRLHRCACCGDDESAVAACEGDEYPLCGPCAAGALREARAEAVAAREHTDRAVDEIRRTLPAALRLAAEDEREECAAIADEHADQEDVAGADACGRVAEAIRARGAGGGA